MGENGYRRLMKKYKISDMKKTYNEIYTRFEDKMMQFTENELPEVWQEYEDGMPQDTKEPIGQDGEIGERIRNQAQELVKEAEEESPADWADIGDEDLEAGRLGGYRG